MAKDTNSGTITKEGYELKRINGTLKYVHRLVIGAKPGDIVDHINGDKSDNRVENLRIVSKSQNNRNQRNVTGYTVTPNGRLQVKTTYKNKTYYIGTYDNSHDAQIAYKAVTKFAFDITGIDVESKSETIEIEGKRYTIDEIKKALDR